MATVIPTTTNPRTVIAALLQEVAHATLMRDRAGLAGIVPWTLGVLFLAALLSAQFGSGWMLAEGAIALLMIWSSTHRGSFSPRQLAASMEETALAASRSIKPLVDVRPDAHTATASAMLTRTVIDAVHRPPAIPPAGLALTPRLLPTPDATPVAAE
jgi:hypothetical protein